MTPEQLKASILQQAMEGKLVKQDPNDEPASVLVKKIAEERARLIKEKKIKRAKKLPAITDEEKPFDIPGNWEWVRLKQVTTFGNFKSVKPSEIPIGSWVLDMADIKKDGGGITRFSYSGENDFKSNKYKVIRNDVLYGKLRPYLKKIEIAPQNGYSTTEVFPIGVIGRDTLVPAFLRYCLLSPYFVSKVNASTYGVKMPRIGTTFLANMLLPLPPLEEQKRIVAKIEKLMPLVDEYAESYNQLTKIDANFNDQMKQSILQYAMEGKLVKQDPHDEPASELLKQIETEKAQLVKEKKIRKRKPLPEITDDEKPFDIPDSWEWVRLGDIGDYIQRGRSPEYDKSSKNHPIISQKCVQWMGISLNDAKYITDAFFNKLEDHRFIQQNDILWNSTGTGTVGRLNIVKRHFDHVPVDSHVTLVRMNKHINSDYIYYYLCSPLIQDNLNDYLTGTTKQKELGLGNILKVKIPVPPLEEQKRIIAKIEKVFATL